MITVAASGMIAAGAAYFTARMTHRLQRSREREELAVQRAHAWADLQVQAMLEVSTAMSAYWVAVRRFASTLAGTTERESESVTNGVEPELHFTDLGSQIVLHAGRLDGTELAGAVIDWARRVQTRAEKAAQGQATMDYAWLKQSVAEQRDLLTRLGKEARRVHDGAQDFAARPRGVRVTTSGLDDDTTGFYI